MTADRSDDPAAARLPSPTATPGGRTGCVRVMLVDDHAVVRTGYQRLLELEPDFLVVAQAGDGDQAYQWLQRQAALGQGLPVDLMVLDLAMPGRSGLDLLRRVQLRWPALRVLVFSMHDSPAMVTQALQAGAGGYVTKSSEPEQLVQALRQLAFGRVPVLSHDVAQALNAPLARPPHQVLSAREFEVLQGLAGGQGIEAIARRLSLSAKTVANYQTLIRQKLGLSNAVELLRYAQDHGLLPR
ncbi:response regulator transcription factor [Pseudaquabacterium rugosum]|jgi:DNA-binding NarL/FixJ family response regulator|uniref:Response regulator transcription factor n=1 Tax=Pseudaquabacterium rugosum TaxID=2984194 RepID=A0ABU9B6Q1_9BURK